MDSRQIKDLSIALEALSRIATCSIYYDVENLLRREIQKAKEIDEAPKSTHDDDDIPF